MFNIGGGEVLVILFIALLVLGPARLPGAARQVGRALAEFRRVTGNVQSDLRDALDTDELREGVATLKQVTNLGATVRSELVSAATSFITPFGDTTNGSSSSNSSDSTTSGTIVAPPDGLYADDLPAPSTSGAQIPTPTVRVRDILANETAVAIGADAEHHNNDAIANNANNAIADNDNNDNNDNNDTNSGMNSVDA